MTREFFEHLKEVESGVTMVPMYLIRRPLGWPGDTDKLGGTSPSTELLRQERLINQNRKGGESGWEK